MKKNTILLTAIASLVLAGCSSTTVVKDISGPQVVDVMYAKFAQEVTTALNRLADVEDLNKVNVINDYNANLDPLNKSYSGTVAQQKKIVIPDTYPQTQWRNDGVTTTAQDAARAVAKTQQAAQPQPQPQNTVAPVQQPAQVVPTPVVQHKPQSVVSEAIAKSNNKVHATTSNTPPVRFNCPEGAEVRKNGPTTICITETKVSQ